MGAALEAGADLEALYAAPGGGRRPAPSILAGPRPGAPRPPAGRRGPGAGLRHGDPPARPGRGPPAPGGLVAAWPAATWWWWACDVRDPGNAGTLIRSAEAAGAGGVVFCRGSVDVTNPKTVRASAGAIFHVPVVEGGDPQEVLAVLGDLGLVRIGALAAVGTAPDRPRPDPTGGAGAGQRGLGPARPGPRIKPRRERHHPHAGPGRVAQPGHGRLDPALRGVPSAPGSGGHSRREHDRRPSSTSCPTPSSSSTPHRARRRVNEAAVELLGRPAKELVGAPADEVARPPHPRRQAGLARRLAPGRPAGAACGGSPSRRSTS